MLSKLKSFYKVRVFKLATDSLYGCTVDGCGASASELSDTYCVLGHDSELLQGLATILSLVLVSYTGHRTELDLEKGSPLA